MTTDQKEKRNDDKNIFGIFADSCPDRWGRRLMKRREELQAKNAEVKPRKLLESDYLLSVYDEARMSGLPTSGLNCL